MAWIAGLRVRELTLNKCVTSVPFKRLNKNPFRSTYFAVQSMAAELSTAANCLVAVEGQKPSVAFIIVDLKANISTRRQLIGFTSLVKMVHWLLMQSRNASYLENQNHSHLKPSEK